MLSLALNANAFAAVSAGGALAYLDTTIPGLFGKAVSFNISASVFVILIARTCNDEQRLPQASNHDTVMAGLIRRWSINQHEHC